MNKGSGDGREMQVWHPIEDIRSLAQHLFRAVDGVQRGARDRRLLPGNRAPEQKLTLAENTKGFVVQVELPDVHKKDLHVNVAESTVTDGPVIKRFQPKDRGKAYSIQKKTSHLVVTVDERED